MLSPPPPPTQLTPLRRERLLRRRRLRRSDDAWPWRTCWLSDFGYSDAIFFSSEAVGGPLLTGIRPLAAKRRPVAVLEGMLPVLFPLAAVIPTMPSQIPPPELDGSADCATVAAFDERPPKL